MRSSVNGVELCWHEIGAGPPVVLVHGLADDHRAWRRAFPALALRTHLYCYDLRGHGGSSLGAADGTLRQLADDLAALMEVIGLGQATVAGFSLGGTVAMRLAIDRPELVAGLALVSTSSRVNAAAAAWYRERANRVAGADPGLRRLLDADTEQVYASAPAELEEGLLIRRQSTADPAGFANACSAMAALHEHPLDEELAAIAAPAVVLTGAEDRHCPPRAAEIIASRLAGAELAVLEGAGHALPVERPAEVAAAVVELACRVGG